MLYVVALKTTGCISEPSVGVHEQVACFQLTEQ